MTIPIIIHGASKFAELFGVKDERTQAKYRAKGMPCYHDGKSYYYIVAEVVEWMRKDGKISLPKIKELDKEIT